MKDLKLKMPADWSPETRCKLSNACSARTVVADAGLAERWLCRHASVCLPTVPSRPDRARLPQSYEPLAPLTGEEEARAWIRPP